MDSTDNRPYLEDSIAAAASDFLTVDAAADEHVPFNFDRLPSLGDIFDFENCEFLDAPNDAQKQPPSPSRPKTGNRHENVQTPSTLYHFHGNKQGADAAPVPHMLGTQTVDHVLNKWEDQHRHDNNSTNSPSSSYGPQFTYPDPSIAHRPIQPYPAQYMPPYPLMHSYYPYWSHPYGVPPQGAAYPHPYNPQAGYPTISPSTSFQWDALPGSDQVPSPTTIPGPQAPHHSNCSCSRSKSKPKRESKTGYEGSVIFSDDEEGVHEDDGKVSSNRLAKRNRDPKANPAHFYTDPSPIVQPWGTRSSGRGPLFTYTTQGVWETERAYSAKELRQYIDGCPRKLRIWVQTAPAQSNHRTENRDKVCRWNKCPLATRNINAGWLRVAFDEFPELTSDGRKDPFKVAGVMHLWCFEQCFDPNELYLSGKLHPENRVFPKESKNPMALTRDTNKGIVGGAFKPWFNAQIPGQQVQLPRPHSASLSYALVDYHVRNQTGARHTARRRRNAHKAASDRKTLDVHKGDLSLFVAAKSRAWLGKNKDDESDTDEGPLTPPKPVAAKATNDSWLSIDPLASCNAASDYNNVSYGMGGVDGGYSAGDDNVTIPIDPLLATTSVDMKDELMVELLAAFNEGEKSVPAVSAVVNIDPLAAPKKPRTPMLALPIPNINPLATPRVSSTSEDDCIVVKTQPMAPAEKRRRGEDDGDSLFGSPVSKRTRFSVSSVASSLARRSSRRASCQFS